MIDLIAGTFKLFDFKKIGDNKTLFKSDSIDDYWLVCEGDPNKFTHEYQAALLKQCQEICKDRALEKNLNLLCLWQVDTIDRSVTSQLHSLEEDIYFFIKHVLYFIEQELNGLKEQLLETTLKELLSEKPTHTDVYNRYKTNINNGHWESLLYRICIKLPFVGICASEGEDIENLYANLDEKLSNEPDLKKLDGVVQQLCQKELEQSPEDLFESINSLLEEEGNHEL